MKQPCKWPWHMWRLRTTIPWRLLARWLPRCPNTNSHLSSLIAEGNPFLWEIVCGTFDTALPGSPSTSWIVPFHSPPPLPVSFPSICHWPSFFTPYIDPWEIPPTSLAQVVMAGLSQGRFTTMLAFSGFTFSFNCFAISCKSLKDQLWHQLPQRPTVSHNTELSDKKSTPALPHLYLPEFPLFFCLPTP